MRIRCMSKQQSLYVICRRSMVELGNEKIEEDKIDDVINHLFQQAGFENKPEISFNEFQQVLRDYSEELNYMSLDVQSE